MKIQRGFTLIELLVVIFIISIFGAIISSTFIKSYANNRNVETQAVIQTELNKAVDRLSRVLRSATQILEATQTNLKIRGYPNVSDSAPSEINFFLSGTVLKYSVIAPSGQAPNYTYNQADAKFFTLVGKMTNDVNTPVFRYYDNQGLLINFPVAISSIRIVEPTLSAIDSSNSLRFPIVVSTKITLRNFKTNL